MVYLGAFIVGVLLGWVASWVLQKRLNDDLIDDVAKLKREIAERDREITRLGGSVPQASVSDDAAAEAGPSRAATAASATAAVAAPATPGAPAEVEVVDAAETQAEAAELAEEPQTEISIPDTEDEIIIDLEGEEGSEAAGEVMEILFPDDAEELEDEDTEVGVFEVDAVEVDVDEEDLATRTASVPIDAQTSAATVTDRDVDADLTVIKGIGPKFAESLTAAGITSYADLANAQPEQLQEIVQPAAWQKVDFDDWIAQAATLSRQSRRLQIGDDLTKLEGIGPTYAQKLRGGGITSYTELADASEETLSSIIDAPAWRRVDYPSWIEQAKLAAAGDMSGLQELQDQLNRREGDNLGLIKGVGASSLAALEEGGITTYAELAASSPGEVADILAAAGVRRGNVEAWIEEAKQRAAGKRVARSSGRSRAVPTGASTSACPQDLGRIEGVGETYEQRLYAVGIGTFWEVSMLPQDELSEILEVKAFQNVDLDTLQASARSLAEETDTMGRVWDGTEPDDFETLPGIGEVFEQRLYDAGICTFAALAALTEERLQEICQAHPNFAPNFRLWLERAREATS